eukprot:UN03622
MKKSFPKKPTHARKNIFSIFDKNLLEFPTPLFSTF